MNYLFQEIIDINNFEDIINNSELAKHQKEYSLNLARSAVHHKVIDLILIELNEDEKIIFLGAYSTNRENETIIEILKEYIQDLELKISNLVKETEIEMIKMLG